MIHSILTKSVLLYQKYYHLALPVSNIKMDNDWKILDERTIRKCYMITYSQVDPDKFPTRELFATTAVEALSLGASG